MIPACFVKIDSIPLNPSGKIDRSKLPRPQDTDFHQGGAYQSPQTRIQQIIAEIWQEVLGREKVGVQDNFFDLGGNSIDFAAVGNKLKEKLGREIPIVKLFTYPTIASLERYLTGEQGEEILTENKSYRPELVDEGKEFMLQTLRELDAEDEDE
jgi:acyl carrier protein